jgi:hypothetical protein
MNQPATPVACTLTPADLAVQSQRWEQLIARAMTGRTETADGLRICFHLEAEDELHALVAVETSCCPWATWRVERAAGSAVLNVRSAAEGVATLHSMFTAGRAGQSAGRTSPPSPDRGRRDTRR